MSLLMTFLTAVQLIVVISLVAVILLQRSEGGGLGIGGGTAGGLMTARGASDLLTRSTSILAGVFIALCLILAVLAGANRTAKPIDTSLARRTAPAGPLGPPAGPGTRTPADTGGTSTQPAPARSAPSPLDTGVPLAK